MNTTRIYSFLWLVPMAFAALLWQPNLRAQAGKSAAPAGQYNIVKEISEHKDLSWKPAPNGIPSDVCTILQVCNGEVKVIALPRSTEGGQPVARGIFMTQDDKKMEVFVIERQTPVDLYFFRLTPEGTLAKAAYAQVGARSWTQVGTALSQPIFDKDKAVWHNWASKLGTTATAEKKPES